MTYPGISAEHIEEVETIEHHFHTEQICYGSDGGTPPNLTKNSIAPFQLTTGTADTFGTELQIYDGSIGAGVYFDLNKVFVTSAQRADTIYLVCFYAGSGTFGEATQVGGFYYRVGSSVAESTEHKVNSPRVRADLKIWANTKSDYATASTIDILFESHKYPSDTGDTVIA